MVNPTGVERVTAQQPPGRQAQAAQRSVDRDRGQCVLAARGVEPATGCQRRTYPPTVRDDGPRQHPRRKRGVRPSCFFPARPQRFGPSCFFPARPQRFRPSCFCVAHLAALLRPVDRPPSPAAAAVTAASRSAPSWSYDRAVAWGNTRITRSVPAGNRSSRVRTRWRSRRRTRLRATALPTAFGTMKPARAGTAGPETGATTTGAIAGWIGPAVVGPARCTTRPPRPTRRPERTVDVNSSRRRRRWPAGSMVRPRDGRAPWHGARREPRARPGSASAAGSRGSWRADGYSAGRCACSLWEPSVHAGVVTCPAGDDVWQPGYPYARARPKRPPVRAGPHSSGRRLSGCGQRC
jgi:hypothetical protein